MIFISPPFGNYILTDKTISIKGSYTLYPRHGLLGRIIKTLRYSPTNNGWINQIGLRNPGIDYAIQDFHKKQMDKSKRQTIIFTTNVVPSRYLINKNNSLTTCFMLRDKLFYPSFSQFPFYQKMGVGA